MTETGYAAAQPIALPFDTPAPDGTDALIGHTPVFCRTREQIERIAALDAPAALTGEPGSGKTRLARAIHAGSDRVASPFVTVSCRALPETPLEVELFGCVKGAVVGASADRHGLLDTAHGGTVVLEDVDELSLHTQGLLLRFLETGEVRALGTLGAGTPSDVRILATSRVPLAGRVAAGTFRDDLRAALTQHAITVPALRDRRPDVPVLVDYFARATASHQARPAASFTPEAHRALMAYSWPGNVSELRRVVERLARLAQDLDIEPHDLPVGIRPRGVAAARTAPRAIRDGGRDAGPVARRQRRKLLVRRLPPVHGPGDYPRRPARSGAAGPADGRRDVRRWSGSSTCRPATSGDSSPSCGIRLPLDP